MAVGFLGSLATFVVGAAVGAAGGVAGARLLAPRSGDNTQKAVEDWKSEIAAAGETAKAKTQAELEQQYRLTVAERAAQRSRS